VYLGIATLALVFTGHHVMLQAGEITGGYNGRSVPVASLGSFTFGRAPSSVRFRDSPTAGACPVPGPTAAGGRPGQVIPVSAPPTRRVTPSGAAIVAILIFTPDGVPGSRTGGGGGSDLT
jgi:hypothetical protein